jgi:cob(I)alamin adenosyltransferase
MLKLNSHISMDKIMKYRLTRIYTRKGDKGLTHLQNKHLAKDDALVEVVGSIDELNAAIGLVCAFSTNYPSLANILFSIQQQLFNFGGELHSPSHKLITKANVNALETHLDQLNATLPPLTEFILPTGTPAVAACHLARAICRRAERRFVHWLNTQTNCNPQLLCYLNRLSDLLFVIARAMATIDGSTEQLWQHDHPSSP